MSWQVQEVSQTFSEILRLARERGPQIVREQEEEIAVVISMDEYRR